MNKTKLCFVLSEAKTWEEMKPENADIKYIKIQLIQTLTCLAVLACFVLSVTELRIATAIVLVIGLLIKLIVF